MIITVDNLHGIFFISLMFHLIDNIISVNKSASKSKNSTETFSDFFLSMKSKIIDLNEEVVKSEPKIKLAPKMPKFGFDPCADPIFGLRMINPLFSSQSLQDKMIGKIPVPVSRVKMHIKSADNSDWVVAGVLVNKSLPKTSQKGINFVALIYFDFLKTYFFVRFFF